VSAADGLADHLTARGALILVAGGQHHRGVFAPGVVRGVLHRLAVPVLLVPGAAAHTTVLGDARVESSHT
jgi:hypothetical protein